jgi:hypothetical protein
MIRPEVRVVQSQEEEIRPAQIDSWEAEQLLRKYGYSHEEVKQITPECNDTGLTFEDMVAREEVRLAEERSKRRQPPTNYDGYHTETRYSTDDESGFGFRIEVKTDMQIPKY